MAENTLDIIGLRLVDYFINFQGYQPFKVPDKYREQNKGKVYLVNPKNQKYQVIKIIKQLAFNQNDLQIKHDHVIADIQKELFPDKEFKSLIIVLNNEDQKEHQNSPLVDIIVATPMQIIKELEPTFFQIGKVIDTADLNYDAETKKFNDDEDNEDLSSRERKWKQINFQNRRFLKDALLKATNPHLFVTWIFFALPLIAYVAFSVVQNSNPNLLSDQNLGYLVFGASYRNLIYGANEYWRWLVYPLAELNYIALLFSMWMFYRVGRFIEGFYGPVKSIGIWIGAIVLTGIIQTTVDYTSYMSGFLILSIISLGAMVPIIYNYKLFKSNVMVRLGTTSGWIFLYWLTFDGFNTTHLLYWMIAFGAGWLFGALVSYHNRKLTLFYSFAPVAIGILLLFAFLGWILNPYFDYDYNGRTNQTLEVYKAWGLCSQSFIDWVKTAYFKQ